jgi:hypothetical protein
MISNTSDVPTLAGNYITLDMVKAPTIVKSRRSKIICTLGPACWGVEQLETLMDAGMSVARFNFSHGDHEGHKACLDRLRTAATNKNRNIGTCNVSVLLEMFCRQIRSMVASANCWHWHQVPPLPDTHACLSKGYTSNAPQHWLSWRCV